MATVGCYAGTPAASEWSGGEVDSSGTEDAEDPEPPETTTGPSEGSSGMPTVSTSGDEPSTSTGADPEPIRWADGITISAVELNQGVGIRAFSDGLLIEPVNRNAPIVEGRALLARATWDLDVVFESRTIRGELTIYEPGTGRQTVLVSEVYVDGASSIASVDDTFHWLVPSDLVTAAARYSVALHETEDSEGDEQPVSPPRVPTTGSADLGVVPGAHEIEIVLVPYRHVLGGCDRTPPTEPAMLDEIAGHVFQQFPARSLDVTLHEPITWTGSMISFQTLLEDVSDRRVAEDPGGTSYWMAWLYPCDGPDDSFGGRAWVPLDASVEAAYYRAAVNRWYPDAPQVSLDIIVHELGHTHGRNHVLCSGGEANPDPAYPHPGGKLGTWGYGLLDELLRAPEEADIMTYCDPSWPSDYGWTLAHERMSALALLDDQGSTLPYISTH